MSTLHGSQYLIGCTKSPYFFPIRLIGFYPILTVFCHHLSPFTVREDNLDTFENSTAQISDPT
jgi:hypothetical protein